MLQPDYSAFDQSKGEKVHARKVMEYEKFLEVKESMRQLIWQVVEEPYLEALKKDYISCSGRILYSMLGYLRNKISKAVIEIKWH